MIAARRTPVLALPQLVALPQALPLLVALAPAVMLASACGDEAESTQPVGWSQSLGTPKAAPAKNPARDVDWNGDGFADLVTVDTSRTSDHIAFFPGGRGGIRFDAGLYRRVQTGSRATSVIWVAHVGDVDADGFSDTLVGRAEVLENALVSFYRGGPNGPAETEDAVLDEESPPAPGSRAERKGTMGYPAGDLNGDGFGDVLVLRQAHSLAVHYGSATGLRARPDLQLAADAQDRQVVSAAGVGDLQGDGFDDVLLAREGPRGKLTVTLLRGGRDGLATEGATMPTDTTFTPSPMRLNVLPLDFDGDGLGDALGFSPPSHFLGLDKNYQYWFTWMSGGPTGYYGSLRAFISEPGDASLRHAAPFEAAAADLDADGHLDVVSPWSNVAESEREFVRGLGGFQGGPARKDQEAVTTTWNRALDEKLVAAATTPFFARAVGCPGDIDGDGFQDCVQLGENQAFLWRGSPQGPRLAEQRTFVGDPRSVATRASAPARVYR